MFAAFCSAVHTCLSEKANLITAIPSLFKTSYKLRLRIRYTRLCSIILYKLCNKYEQHKKSIRKGRQEMTKACSVYDNKMTMKHNLHY